MGREPLLYRFSFTPVGCPTVVLYRIITNFSVLSRCSRQVAHALLTRPPLSVLLRSVRLACVKHAASVRPEPGSNSLVQSDLFLTSDPLQGLPANNFLVLRRRCLQPQRSLIFKIDCVFIRLFYYSLFKLLFAASRQP